MDVQPILEKLRELECRYTDPWYSAPYLKLFPTGGGAVILENLRDKSRVAIDFDSDEDMLDAVNRLAENVGVAIPL